MRTPLGKILAWMLILGSAAPSVAHEGHDDAPGATGAALSGPVEVSEAAQRNLGLVTVEAELRSVETTLRVLGEIAADPLRSGAVTSRIAGRVSAVWAQEGQRVEKGQRMVEVESFQLGDPPPRARYGAPVSGVVTDRHVVIGEEVEPSRHLFEIADLSEVLAVGHVFEGQIAEVAVGQTVRVRVSSYPDEIFEGAVERLGGGLDARSRSLSVYVRVPNPNGRLRPHMRATLTLVTGGTELALAVPYSAVLGELGAYYVFVQDDLRTDRFERRPLVLGAANDRLIEVIDGLFPGERVVSEGGYSLQYLPPATDAAHAHDHAGAPAATPPTASPAPSGLTDVLWFVSGLVFVLGVGAVLWMLRARLRAQHGAR